MVLGFLLFCYIRKTPSHHLIGVGGGRARCGQAARCGTCSTTCSHMDNTSNNLDDISRECKDKFIDVIYQTRNALYVTY